ncbi:protein phosphatase 1A-like [Argiope bruennichi]|uniref:protein phosphatase 1A-like n=1 Tax=Argiope bruennichi TaxID=94029 RepID=UPI0024954B21|nr:protein phosphatase 1A-like [Argiope bruennichi]
MGNLLSEPNTKKNYTSGCDNGLSYGLCSMQGRRRRMEDAHCAEVSIPGEWKDWSFFAIFDGHGGKEVSTYCAKHLLDTIMKTEQFQSSNADSRNKLKFTENVRDGIREAFLKLDSEMEHQRIAGENLYCGSTVISVFISSTHFYIANLGDSRGVISCNQEIRFITNDHKPDSEFEKQRIERAGGFVLLNGCPRINGCLSVSRALGDYAYKQMPFKNFLEQLVSPEPTVDVLDRYVDDEFLVLACDGIWDVLKPIKLCNYIRYMLQVTENLECICKSIIDACYYKGSRDNMSVLVVLLPGAPKISEKVIQQDKNIFSILQKHIEDIICTYGFIKVEDLMKILSRDVKLQQEPALIGSPFEKSFYFLYSSVKSIYDTLRSSKILSNYYLRLMIRRVKSVFS